jgi:hypothetical protein
MEGAKSFVSFAIQNFGEYEMIVCPISSVDSIRDYDHNKYMTI